jgi:hypothetical protein
LSSYNKPGRHAGIKLKNNIMKEFVLIFRNASDSAVAQMSSQQMQTISTEWQNWMGGIAAQNKLANMGYRLGFEGKTLSPANVLTDGPFAEIKEIVSGLTVIKADSLEEASEIAKGCPILNVGGTVEVRSVVVMTM